MDSSWRESTDLGPSSSGSGPSMSTYHHRRGISEDVEGSLLWTTSQTNGELGLAAEPIPISSGLGAGFVPLSSASTSGEKGGGGGRVVGPLPVAVWARVMDSSKGRDKVLKCLQYSLRTYLYLLSLIAAVRPLSPWFRSNSRRMKLATSSLSLTRKCLLLLNPLHPLTHLLSPAPTSASTLLRHLVDLSSALADDAFCLSRLGIVSRRAGKKADAWANRFWLLTTLLGLWKVYTTPPRRLEDVSSTPAQAETRSTAYKLWSDLVFVSYDVFGLTWFKEPVQCAAGLTSALISTGKLYDQHWTASLGKG